MIFVIMIMFLMGGLAVISMAAFIPDTMAFASLLKMMLIFFGWILPIVGVVILYGRAKKTSVIHVLNPSKKDESLWLYAFRDSHLMFTPGIRQVESQLYSPELDAQIQDYKSYHLADHTIKIVPEGIGHAADLGMCLYTQLMRNKWGFEKIQEAREEATRLEQLNPIRGKYSTLEPIEGVITEEVIKEALRIVKQRRGNNGTSK